MTAILPRAMVRGGRCPVRVSVPEAVGLLRLGLSDYEPADLAALRARLLNEVEVAEVMELAPLAEVGRFAFLIRGRPALMTWYAIGETDGELASLRTRLVHCDRAKVLEFWYREYEAADVNVGGAR